MAYLERDGVDLRMGTVLVVGGLIGSLIGAGLFELLTAWGQIDTVISILYVAMLGSVGTIMAREAWGALRLMKAGLPPPARKRRHHPMVANLRSEEHTSELQSLMRISYAVFCLKKKKTPRKI